MSKTYKCQYNVGTMYTIGKPTQERTGLSRFVKLTGFTPDNKEITVEDRDNPELTATIKRANLGSHVDADGTLRSMAGDRLPWKSSVRGVAKSIPQSLKDAYKAARDFQSTMGGTVGGGKARRLKKLNARVASEAKSAGISMDVLQAAMG